MNILVDLDGVIYPWAHAVHIEQIIYHNEMRDFETFWKEFPSEHNDLYWENLVQLKHLYGTQIPDKKDVALLNKLNNRGDCIYYVSNRPECIREVTENWLKRYKLPQAEHLILTKDKVAVSNSIGIDIVFEDRPDNILNLTSAGFKVVTIEAPYNRELEIYPKLCKFYQAEEILF